MPTQYYQTWQNAARASANENAKKTENDGKERAWYLYKSSKGYSVGVAWLGLKSAAFAMQNPFKIFNSVVHLHTHPSGNCMFSKKDLSTHFFEKLFSLNPKMKFCVVTPDGRICVKDGKEEYFLDDEYDNQSSENNVSENVMSGDGRVIDGEYTHVIDNKEIERLKKKSFSSFRSGKLVRFIGKASLIASAGASIYPFISSKVPYPIITVYICMAFAFAGVEIVSRQQYLKSVIGNKIPWAYAIAIGTFIIFIADSAGTYGFILSVAKNAKTHQETNNKIQQEIDANINDAKRISEQSIKNGLKIRETTDKFNAMGRLSKASENSKSLIANTAEQKDILNKRKENIQLIKDNEYVNNPILETHQAIADLFNTNLDIVNKIFSAIISAAFSFAGIMLCGYKTEDEDKMEKRKESILNNSHDLNHTLLINGIAKKRNAIGNVIALPSIPGKNTKIKPENEFVRVDEKYFTRVAHASHAANTEKKAESTQNIQENQHKATQIKKMKEKYEISKNANNKSEVNCPYCDIKFTKNVKQQAFCSGRGKGNCKDEYWNAVNPDREKALKSKQGKPYLKAV